MLIPPFNIGKETPEKYSRKSKSVLYSVCTIYNANACLNFDIGSSTNFWCAIRVSGNGEIFHQVKNKTPKLSSIKNDLKISNCQINHAENISAT